MRGGIRWSCRVRQMLPAGDIYCPSHQIFGTVGAVVGAIRFAQTFFTVPNNSSMYRLEQHAAVEPGYRVNSFLVAISPVP